MNEKKFALGTNQEVKEKLLAASNEDKNNANAEAYAKWYFKSYNHLIDNGYSVKHTKVLLYDAYEKGYDKFTTFKEYYIIEKVRAEAGGVLSDYNYKDIIKNYAKALDKDNDSKEKIESVINDLYKEIEYISGWKKADELLTPLYSLQERKFGSVKEDRERAQEEYIRSYEADKIKYNNPPGFGKLSNQATKSTSTYKANSFQTLLNDAMELAEEYNKTRVRRIVDENLTNMEAFCKEHYPDRLFDFRDIIIDIANNGRDYSENAGALYFRGVMDGFTNNYCN